MDLQSYILFFNFFGQFFPIMQLMMHNKILKNILVFFITFQIWVLIIVCIVFVKKVGCPKFICHNLKTIFFCNLSAIGRYYLKIYFFFVFTLVLILFFHFLEPINLNNLPHFIKMI